MAQLIPFAGTVYPTCGPASDGMVIGGVSRVPFVASISTAANNPSATAVRGDADSSGAVTYSDIATAASDQTTNDITIFNATNPSFDQLWVEFSANDTITSIDFYLTTAGAFTGNPVPKVFYKNASGSWVNATNTALVGSLTATGIKRVTFDTIKCTDISTTDF